MGFVVGSQKPALVSWKLRATRLLPAGSKRKNERRVLGKIRRCSVHSGADQCRDAAVLCQHNPEDDDRSDIPLNENESVWRRGFTPGGVHKARCLNEFSSVGKLMGGLVRPL